MNIKEIAKQMFEFNGNEVARVDMIDLCRFADYVDAQAVAREREACAMECIKLASSWARLGAWGTKTDFHECATAIRARGNHGQN